MDKFQEALGRVQEEVDCLTVIHDEVSKQSCVYCNRGCTDIVKNYFDGNQYMRADSKLV